MTKKAAKKKVRKKSTKKKSLLKISDKNTEHILIENFVGLQRVLTNLSVKFDGLSNQISKLLELFEISAKSLAEKDFGAEKETKENEKILEKLEELTGQNKVIARGLTLMYDSTGRNVSTPTPTAIQKTIPPQTSAVDIEKPRMNEYQKSISSSSARPIGPPRRPESKFKRLPSR